MSNPYSSGTPDVWYSGTKADLWIEYKFLPRVPQTAIVRPTDPKTMLTVLQRNWINQRYEEGRTVAVIIGCPDGGVILRDQEWEHDLSASEFRDSLLPRKAIAQWITENTMR